LIPCCDFSTAFSVDVFVNLRLKMLYFVQKANDTQTHEKRKKQHQHQVGSTAFRNQQRFHKGITEGGSEKS
jgi:hypothetical protein